jgi:hypothetical protein
VLARKLNIGQLLSLEVVDGLVVREVKKIMGHARCSYGLPNHLAADSPTF